MNNKRKIKIILSSRVIIFILLLVIIPNLLAILTYIYVSKTIYPGIAFLVSIPLVYLICRNSLQQRVDFYFTEDKIFIKDVYYLLSDLQSYSFKETNYIGNIMLNFNHNRKIKLSIFRNKNSEYQEIKDGVLELINTYNRHNQNKITEYNWHKIKSAKIYGYITVIIMILWVVLMLVYPERLKLSNIGLFLVLLSGLTPILYRIFSKSG